MIIKNTLKTNSLYATETISERISLNLQYIVSAILFAKKNYINGFNSKHSVFVKIWYMY